MAVPGLIPAERSALCGMSSSFLKVRVAAEIGGAVRWVGVITVVGFATQSRMPPAVWPIQAAAAARQKTSPVAHVKERLVSKETVLSEIMKAEPMGAIEAIKEGVQAIAPGLSLSNILSDIGSELGRLGVQGQMEMASALFNGVRLCPTDRASTRRTRRLPTTACPSKRCNSRRCNRSSLAVAWKCRHGVAVGQGCPFNLTLVLEKHMDPFSLILCIIVAMCLFSCCCKDGN